MALIRALSGGGGGGNSLKAIASKIFSSSAGSFTKTFNNVDFEVKSFYAQIGNYAHFCNLSNNVVYEYVNGSWYQSTWTISQSGTSLSVNWTYSTSYNCQFILFDKAIDDIASILPTTDFEIPFVDGSTFLINGF